MLIADDDETEVPESLQGIPQIPRPIEYPEISKKTIFGYSLGHVFNDMCSSMWFTYLMIYLEKVIKMKSWRAGSLMLIGQVTDAIATPVIGLLSDSSLLPQSVTKFGQRIPWHFMGKNIVDIQAQQRSKFLQLFVLGCISAMARCKTKPKIKRCKTLQ